jgi:hypothetical protein
VLTENLSCHKHGPQTVAERSAGRYRPPASGNANTSRAAALVDSLVKIELVVVLLLAEPVHAAWREHDRDHVL